MNPQYKNGPILLVEDDTNDIFLILQSLEKHHVMNDVVVARDGVEALDYLFESGKYAGQKTVLPELVILDLYLPKVGGMDVLGQIRADERTRNLPVVILTSSADEQDRIDSHSLGPVSFIRKPVDFSGFFEAVRKRGLHWLVVTKTAEAGQAALWLVAEDHATERPKRIQ